MDSVVGTATGMVLKISAGPAGQMRPASLGALGVEGS